MQVTLIVVGIFVGLVCLALSLLLFARGDATQTILEFEKFKFNTNSLGVVTMLFAFVAFGAPFLYHRGLADGSENSIPAAPVASNLSSQPTATVTVTVYPVASPSTVRATATAPASQSPTTEPPSHSTSLSHGPWHAEKRGVRLVVEKCSHRMAQYGLFGCQIRLENGSKDDLTLSGDEPVIFVDDRDESFGLDDRGTTFPTSQWTSIDSQETKRGIVVLEANPPSSTKAIQIRVTVSDYSGRFVVSVDLPYEAAG